MGELIQEIISESPEETEAAAAAFARGLQGGEIICMYGDLGAGKTAFTGGFAKGLDITAHIVSPTFTIVNEYQGRLPLYHFDVYRIDDPEELYDIGFEEYLDSGGVCVIEWAEKIEELIPETGRYNVTITLEEDSSEELFSSPPRKITIERIKA